MSQITTHVLDTAKGKPAEGIAIALEHSSGNNQWEKIASGVTNADGRIANLIPADKKLSPGIYRMRFETKSYFERQGEKGFYPYIEVVFELTSTAHYHVPLLLSPFGYSTYRGS